MLIAFFVLIYLHIVGDGLAVIRIKQRKTKENLIVVGSSASSIFSLREGTANPGLETFWSVPEVAEQQKIFFGQKNSILDDVIRCNRLGPEFFDGLRSRKTETVPQEKLAAAKLLDGRGKLREDFAAELGTFYRNYYSVVPFKTGLGDFGCPDSRARLNLEHMPTRAMDMKIANTNFWDYRLPDIRDLRCGFDPRWDRYRSRAFDRQLLLRTRENMLWKTEAPLTVIEKPSLNDVLGINRWFRESIARLDYQLYPLFCLWAPYPAKRSPADQMKIRYVFGMVKNEQIFFIVLEAGFVEFFFSPNEDIRCVLDTNNVPSSVNMVPLWLYKNKELQVMTLAKIINPGDAFGSNAPESEFLSHHKLLTLLNFYQELL